MIEFWKNIQSVLVCSCAWFYVTDMCTNSCVVLFCILKTEHNDERVTQNCTSQSMLQTGRRPLAAIDRSFLVATRKVLACVTYFRHRAVCRVTKTTLNDKAASVHQSSVRRLLISCLSLIRYEQTRVCCKLEMRSLKLTISHRLQTQCRSITHRLHTYLSTQCISPFSVRTLSWAIVFDVVNNSTDVITWNISTLFHL